MKSIPIVNPVVRDGRPFGQVALDAVRARLRTSTYPDVDFTALAPTVVRGAASPTPPTGTASMDVFTYSDVGGRGGLLKAWLLYPAAPIGVLAIIYTGHSQAFTVGSDAAACTYFLNQGCHVLAVEEPSHGYGGANQPATLTLTVAGEPTVFTQHNFAALDADGGPHWWRVFLDHLFAGLNQAIDDLSPSYVFAVGHSGGGLNLEYASALDTRFSRYSYFGARWWPLDQYLEGFPASLTSYEECMVNTTGHSAWYDNREHQRPIIYALGCDHGRSGLQIVGDLDTVYPALGYHGDINQMIPMVDECLAGTGRFGILYDTAATDHAMTSTVGFAAIWADVQRIRG